MKGHAHEHAMCPIDVRILVRVELLAEVLVCFLDFAVGGILSEAEKL